MITVKTKKAIFDSQVNRKRVVGEEFEMSLERKEQIGKLFDSYFEVVKIKKSNKKVKD